jgi:hypothetical protein
MSTADIIYRQLQVAIQGEDNEFEKLNLTQRLVAAMMFEHVFSGRPISKDIAVMLGSAFSFLSTGNNSPVCEPSKKTGQKKPKRTPWEMMCISGAIHYLRSVENGVVEDLTPTKTVQKAFGGADSMAGGLSKRAIQKWRSEPLLIEYESLYTSRDPDVIARDMEAAGKMYTEAFSLQAKAAHSWGER